MICLFAHVMMLFYAVIMMMMDPSVHFHDKPLLEAIFPVGRAVCRRPVSVHIGARTGSHYEFINDR